MELEPWDLADPARLIEEIAARRSRVIGTVHLGVVADPSTHQRLTHVETLPAPALIGHCLQARNLVRETVSDRLPVPQWRARNRDTRWSR